MLDYLTFIILLPVYFIPTIIAFQKGSSSVGGIFIMNFFTGWLIIGWVLALIWAINDK